MNRLHINRRASSGKKGLSAGVVWAVGNPAGRLRGSRNKPTEEVICALLRDFRQHGQKAVARVRQTQPAAYLKILALLVPREHKVEHSNLLKELTDEQLEALIAYLCWFAMGDKPTAGRRTGREH